MRRGGGRIFRWLSLVRDPGPGLGSLSEGWGPIFRLQSELSSRYQSPRSSFRGVSPSSISETRSELSLPHPFLSSGWRSFTALGEGPGGQGLPVQAKPELPTLPPSCLAPLAPGTHQSWRWSWRCWRRDRCQGVRARWRHCCLPGPCWWPHQPCGGRSRAAEPPVG